MATAISTLRTELRDRTGKRSTSSLSDSRLDIVLKAAIIQLASPQVHRHSDLESTITITTADGTDVYALSEGTDEVWTIFSVRCSTTDNERRLTSEGPAFMDELVKTSGPPLRYARWSGNMEFDPIPDGIYSIEVRGYLYPAFTTDGGTGLLNGNSPFRDVYDEGILLGSEYRLWLNVLQNPARGFAVKNELADWMDTITSPYDGELDDNAGDVLAPDLYGTLGLGR